MKSIEVRFSHLEMARQLMHMRLWLDHLRYEPSRFTYDLEEEATIVPWDFQIPQEAELFARVFHGRLFGLSRNHRCRSPRQQPVDDESRDSTRLQQWHRGDMR